MALSDCRSSTTSFAPTTISTISAAAPAISQIVRFDAGAVRCAGSIGGAGCVAAAPVRAGLRAAISR